MTDAARDLQSKMIDAARGLAILLVLTVHTGQSLVPVFSPLSSRISEAIGLMSFGAAGVGLFFVISGYLLNMLYSGPSFSRRKYWLRRAARIYPAWLFWSAFAIVATFLPNGPFGANLYGDAVQPDSLGNIVRIALHLLFLGFLVPATWNTFISGGWSIQAEMFNYALYPVIRRMPFRTLAMIAVGVEVLQWVVMFFPNPISSNVLFAKIFETYATSPVWFLLGIFLSRRVKREGDWAAESAMMAGVFGLAVVLRLSGPFVDQTVTFGIVIAAIGVAYLAVRTGKSQPLAVIGRYSYGIYFAHFLFLAPLTWAAQTLVEAIAVGLAKVLAPLTVVLGYLLVLGASLLVARVVFEVIERRPIEWARSRRMPGSSAVREEEENEMKLISRK